MEHTLIIAGLVAVAYLLGSIPTAVWIGKRFYGIDVREHGSHNAGATNTIRVLGLRTGLVVFAIDLAKGYCAVSLGLLAGWLGSSPQLHTLLGIGLGLAAIAGHIFPLFAGFRGGKGVATICGVALALHPWAALCALGVFAVVLIATRYVSLGSMLAGLSYPIFLFFVFQSRNIPLLVFPIIPLLRNRRPTPAPKKLRPPREHAFGHGSPHDFPCVFLQACFHSLECLPLRILFRQEPIGRLI